MQDPHLQTISRAKWTGLGLFFINQTYIDSSVMRCLMKWWCCLSAWHSLHVSPPISAAAAETWEISKHVLFAFQTPKCAQSHHWNWRCETQSLQTKGQSWKTCWFMDLSRGRWVSQQCATYENTACFKSWAKGAKGFQLQTGFMGRIFPPFASFDRGAGITSRANGRASGA